MNKCGFIYDDRMLLHQPPYSHFEQSARLKAILNAVTNSTDIKNKLEFITPRIAGQEEILLVHTENHYDFIELAIINKISLLDDGDTYASEDSLISALIAAGSLLTAVDLVINKELNSVFCAVRPPGHHAETSRVMGFCYFNNAAIAAKYAQKKYGIKKICIIDWDVHHGNGTQEIFYSDNSVLFFSIHQSPLWPGTGKKDEKGIGQGIGFTYNFPVPPGTVGDSYVKIFVNEIIPLSKKFNPELIIISAGFDAHKDDPLANVNLTEIDFYSLTGLVKNLCKELSIPLISTLEGGYNLTALGNSVLSHLKNLTED